MAHFELPGIRFFIGIDPGANGGVAVLSDDGFYAAWSLKYKADAEIANILQMHGAKMHAMIEKPPYMPKCFAYSYGKLTESFGFLRGCLAAYRIPYETVQPAVWQRSMDCLTHGDKKITRLKARKMFPGEDLTHATADASLIAAYCRKLILLKEEQNGSKAKAA